MRQARPSTWGGSDTATRGLDFPVMRHLAKHHSGEQWRRQLAELRRLAPTAGLDNQRSTEDEKAAVQQPALPFDADRAGSDAHRSAAARSPQSGCLCRRVECAPWLPIT